MSKLFLAFILFVSSCTITNEIHFNEDYSGTFRITGDMSEFYKGLSKLDTSLQNPAKWKDSFKKNFDQIDTFGIRNLQYGWIEESKSFNFSFDFVNLEALNSMFSGMIAYNSKQNNEPFDSTIVYFYNKGKNKLVFKYPNQQSKMNHDSTITNSFADKLKYKYAFSFDREINSISCPGFTIMDKGKRAEIDDNILDKTLAKKRNSKIIFNLK